jgi:hypothetical protein
MIRVLIEGEDEGENSVYYPQDFGELKTVADAKKAIKKWMKENAKFFHKDHPPRHVIVDLLDGELRSDPRD